MNDVVSVLKRYSKSKYCDIWIGGYVKLIEKYRKLNILFLGKANNTQRHHIIPKSLGGDNSIDNIVVLYTAITQRFKCRGCWLVYPDDTTTAQQLDQLDTQRRSERAFNSRVARGTKVLNKTTGEVYNSISEAARTIKVANANVIKQAIVNHYRCRGNILVYAN